MTGPEHYRLAEEDLVRNRTRGIDKDPASRMRILAIAQIHATLALAAATALGTSPAESRAWVDVAGTKPPAGSS